MPSTTVVGTLQNYSKLRALFFGHELVLFRVWQNRLGIEFFYENCSYGVIIGQRYNGCDIDRLEIVRPSNLGVRCTVFSLTHKTRQ